MSPSKQWVLIPEVHYHGGHSKLKHALANLVAPITICAGLLEDENPASPTMVLLTKSVNQVRSNIERYEALLRKTPIATRPVTCEELAGDHIDLKAADKKRILMLDPQATLADLVGELRANDVKNIRLTFDHPFSPKGASWAAFISEPGSKVLNKDSVHGIGTPYSSKDIGLGLALVVAYTYKQSGKIYFNTATSELVALFPESFNK